MSGWVVVRYCSDPIACRNLRCPWSTSSILTANGNQVPIKHSGNSSFSIGGNTIKLDKILHVPNVKKNLISVKQLCCDNDLSIIFYSSYVCLKERSTGRKVATDGVIDKLYHLNLEEDWLPSINLGVKAPFDICHARLGHANERLMKEAIRDFNLPVSTNN